MENDEDNKKVWAAPEITDLSVNNSEGGESPTLNEVTAPFISNIS